MGESCRADENAPDQGEKDDALGASWRGLTCYYFLGTYFERLPPGKFGMHHHI